MAFTIPTLESSPTFDGQTCPDSTDFTALAASEDGTGVLSGCAVTPHTGSDMNIAIASGSVCVAGVVVAVTAVTSLAVGAASTFDRRDIVTVNNSGTVSVTAGTQCTTAGWSRTTAALPPVKPAIPANSVLLAEVYVASTTTVIASGNIIDKTTLTINPIPLSTVTAAGDMIVATGAAAVARVALGTVGQDLGVNAAGTGLVYRSDAPTAIPTGLQSLTASADNMLTGGVMPFATGDLSVGTCYEWFVQLIKTGAGVATFAMTVRVGTTTGGTTTDTAVATFTSGANTAAADQSTIKVVARCTSIATGSATFACAAFAQNELTTVTGLGIFASPIPGSTATVTVATAQSIHLDVTPGASAVMTAACFGKRIQ